MRWENLTGKTFVEAVEAAQGVCIIPIGVLEYHGSHLPLGTDMQHSHAVACAAAEQESAVVYPAYHFGLNMEAKHFPGNIVLKERLLFDLLENICDEISRNGLKKIILLSGHGGNRYYLPLFVQLMIDKEKDYVVYYFSHFTASREVEKRIMDTKVDGHAGERETSMGLYVHPELVRMDLLEESDLWPDRQRVKHLGDIQTAAEWYARFPEQCSGDPRPATAEKGKAMFDAQVEGLIHRLRIIKQDTAAPEIYAEFGSRIYRR
jgi:creatinine amidohydrolase